MKTIIFVGSNPSKKNKNPNIAFVGSSSEKTLDQWEEIICWKLYYKTKEDFQIHSMNISNRVKSSQTGFKFTKQELQIFQDWLLETKNLTLVCLGKKVHDAIKKMNTNGHRVIEFLHPSPRNRKLNDKKLVSKELKRLLKEVTK